MLRLTLLSLLLASLSLAREKMDYLSGTGFQLNSPADARSQYRRIQEHEQLRVEPVQVIGLGLGSFGGLGFGRGTKRPVDLLQLQQRCDRHEHRDRQYDLSQFQRRPPVHHGVDRQPSEHALPVGPFVSP